MSKDFKLKVSPRMLELLSKDLYTNMYFVLAELIANSYDADAENVYVYIDDTEIRVEDDGTGMTPENLNDKYLLVGGESRNSEENARTSNKKRLKMGRKAWVNWPLFLYQKASNSLLFAMAIRLFIERYEKIKTEA